MCLTLNSLTHQAIVMDVGLKRDALSKDAVHQEAVYNQGTIVEAGLTQSFNLTLALHHHYVDWPDSMMLGLQSFYTACFCWDEMLLRMGRG